MSQSPLVFITGASSGIGQALAARFRRAGYRLALVARREAEVRAWAQAQGCSEAEAGVYAADVRDLAAIEAAGRACIAAQGVPDVVIANAGISVGIDTEVFDDLEVMRATYETNVASRRNAAVRTRARSCRARPQRRLLRHPARCSRCGAPRAR